MRIDEQLHEYLQQLRSTNLKNYFGAAKKFLQRPRPHSTSTALLHLNQTLLSHALTSMLVLITVGITSYWLLQILQAPSTPENSGNKQGSNLLLNESPQPGYPLFGTKPLSTQNIFLRGLVITSSSTPGKLDGFAVFDIDGKPSKAIAIGESLGNNLVLQSIQAESVTVLYQGKELQFPISKTKSKPHSKS